MERAMQPAGLTITASPYPARETSDRIAQAITKRGIEIFARIDHASAAEKIGLALRPTEVLIFGNPLAGTPLMQKAQTMGIDLPLKALVWQDESGKTWIGTNDPAWIAQRHGLAGMEKVLAALTNVLAAVTKDAVA
jgi:uncharacterized protein (DUF302 family)